MGNKRQGHDVFTQVRSLFEEVKPYVLLLLLLWVYQSKELIYLEIVSCGLHPRGNDCDDDECDMLCID